MLSLHEALKAVLTHRPTKPGSPPRSLPTSSALGAGGASFSRHFDQLTFYKRHKDGSVGGFPEPDNGSIAPPNQACAGSWSLLAEGEWSETTLGSRSG
jgi:hypothetical protein